MILTIAFGIITAMAILLGGLIVLCILLDVVTWLFK